MARSIGAVIAPGYGATAEQPIVRAMATRLRAEGVEALPFSWSRSSPKDPFTIEMDLLRSMRARLETDSVVLIGRSFGARMCTRLAAEAAPDALILLGHPIAPRNRPRPEDEAALTAVRCPTLIVQGDRDALGPLDVLHRLAAVNRAIEIHVLAGVGHNFGARQTAAVDYAASWLLARIKP